MIDRIESKLAGKLLVPEKPEAPPGHASSLTLFRAAEKFYYLNLVKWAGDHFVALLLLLPGWFISSELLNGGTLHGNKRNQGPDRTDGTAHEVDAQLIQAFYWADLVLLSLFVIQSPFSLCWVRLNYRYRWYMVTDRSLRIRQGIFLLHEQTMSFANVQEVSITCGPIQQLLGISDVRVRSAGGGGGDAKGPKGRRGKDYHLATFQGVDNPERIRDLIRERLRSYRATGEGMNRGRYEEAKPGKQRNGFLSKDAVSAAGSLLAEMRELRAWLSAKAGP